MDPFHKAGVGRLSSSFILHPSSFRLHPFAMDPYHTLGVLRDCTREEAKDAFRARAWQLHPDRGGEEQAFIQLYSAYKQILRELDRIPINTAAKPVRAPGNSPISHPSDPSWDPEPNVIEVPPPVPRHPKPPDPSWEPELIVLDDPPRPAKPFHPQWDPELVMLDRPPRRPKPPESWSGTETFSSWLRELSDQSVRGNSWWQSARIRAILTTILLILIVVSIVLTWIVWVMPEQSASVEKTRSVWYDRLVVRRE